MKAKTEQDVGMMAEDELILHFETTEDEELRECIRVEILRRRKRRKTYYDYYSG